MNWKTWLGIGSALFVVAMLAAVLWVLSSLASHNGNATEYAAYINPYNDRVDDVGWQKIVWRGSEPHTGMDILRVVAGDAGDEEPTHLAYAGSFGLKRLMFAGDCAYLVQYVDASGDGPLFVKRLSRDSPSYARDLELMEQGPPPELGC